MEDAIEDNLLYSLVGYSCEDLSNAAMIFKRYECGGQL